MFDGIVGVERGVGVKVGRVLLAGEPLLFELTLFELETSGDGDGDGVLEGDGDGDELTFVLVLEFVLTLLLTLKSELSMSRFVLRFVS